MTIYLDIVLLENLCMNYIILFATGFILKVRINHIRIVISSLIGGIYAILSYMKILEIYSNIVMKVILSICMVYIGFNAKDVKILLKQLLIFYLMSFMFGGTAFALLYFIKPQNILVKNGRLIGTYPIKIALLGGLVGFIIIHIAFRTIKHRLSKNDIFIKIEIFLKDKSVRLNALLDTGNLLRDPINRMPVIIVEKEALFSLIPKEILNNMNSIIRGEVDSNIYNEENVEYMSKFRVIPFSSLGRQNGMLLGFKADKIITYGDTNEEELQNVIIGIYNNKLSKNGKYNALLGLEIFERSEKDEYITSASK